MAPTSLLSDLDEEVLNATFDANMPSASGLKELITIITFQRDR